MQKKIDVSIVIANYNGSGMTKKCIGSIRKYTEKVNYEIILIDDVSRMEDFSRLKSIKNVNLFRNDKNVGELASKNKGIQKSKGKYIIICDNDILIEDNVIRKLFDYMEENPEVGVTGLRLIFQDGSFQQSHGPMFIEPKKLIMNKISRVLHPRSKKLKKIDWISSFGADKSIHYTGHVKGAFCMIRREAIKKVGLMDEQYFVYADELDWQHRMKKAGYDAVHLPFGPVIHFGGATNKSDIAGMMKWESHSLKNSILFCKKHHGTLNSIIYRIAMFFTLLVNIIRFKEKDKRKINGAMMKVLFKKVKNNPIEPRLE
ncbi:MAG: glycosyltransferase [Nanoarchaeota archaeon]|nr:glycosyltransferase [Nanoarchaeota archaeon]